MLILTDKQVELLLAMNAPVNTKVHEGIVWIQRRKYDIRDLYALRAARLALLAEVRTGARGATRFELTDNGIAEATRRHEQAQAPHQCPPRNAIHADTATRSSTEAPR